MAYDGAPFKPGKRSGPRPEISGELERPLELNEAATQPGLPTDWGSLVADLSTTDVPRDPEWRIHDRTHLEFAVDYTVDASQRETAFEWDAYFFVPESLRLHDYTYEKNDIYEDLQSYVRLAVPFVPLDKLVKEPLSRLRVSLGKDAPEATTLRELRLFACIFRSSTLDWRRRILSSLDGTPEGVIAASEIAITMVKLCKDVVVALRELCSTVPDDGGAVSVAARWVDEDISRALETMFGSLAIDLRARGAAEHVVTKVAAAAVDEAQYRQDKGLEGVGRADADERAIERLEFRRHVLKRFTSSVLWLGLEVREGAGWVLQAFYAIAASLAMAFALMIAVLNPVQLTADGTQERGFWIGVTAVVLAYAAKDRLKAILQAKFNKVVARHFPDRRWLIRDRERKAELGDVEERSGFVEQHELPNAVLERRRLTRVHQFEEEARPERVLWHHKTVTVRGEDLRKADPRFSALTEIFRLNMIDWLENTDDPKRRIVFADPNDRRIYSATAPRAYNIAVVYRLRRVGDEQAVWHRNRVVVTRKGIVRIDPIC